MTTKNPNHEKINEIICMAEKLGWLSAPPTGKISYPIMQLSEVEKCMLAMVDEGHLNRMKAWYVAELNK